MMAPIGALVFLIAVCACETACAQPPLAPAAPSPPVVTLSAALPLTQTEIEAFVRLHNAARREVGTPPAAWSPKLAAVAQAWADHLAATGKWEHRPFEGPDAAPYGENLAIGDAPGYSLADAARAWYAEKEKYEPGSVIPADFALLEGGHYTQMVWSTTRAIGAGKAIVAAGEYKGWTVVVANYDPPGNAAGARPYERK